MAAEEKIIEYETERAHVKVHIPVLSDKERKKRLAVAERELASFYKSCVSQGIDWDKFQRST